MKELSCVVSKQTTEENPARCVTTELKNGPSVDKSDEGCVLLTSSIYLNEPTQFAEHIHQIKKLGLSIEDRRKSMEEVERAANETYKMEDVD